MILETKSLRHMPKKNGLSKADILRKAVDELISKDKTGRKGT